MRLVFKGLIAVCVVSAAFLGGFSADLIRSVPRNPQAAYWGLQVLPSTRLADLLRPPSARAAQERSLRPAEIYFAVMNQIRSDYYGPDADAANRSAKKLTYAAIHGMLKTLNDRFTEFLEPKTYERMMEENRGNFVGIGALLGMTKDKKVYIEEPFENSPAIRKGVLPGDVIVKVDGKPTLGKDVAAVASQIRGKEGTPVKLTLLRKGQTRLLEVTIVRAVVHTPIVEYRMQDEAQKIGYIQLKQFNEEADQQFGEAVRKLESRGMKALIFDLRDNPGGLLNIARDIGSRFIGSGPIVWQREKNGEERSLDVEPSKHQARLDKGVYPVVVLVDGGSASASEIVAGAIKDYDAGTLVGTTTFGKGLVQTIIPLLDNSAVKITTQHYLTPKKNDINNKFDEAGKKVSGGIKPDIVVELTEKDLERMREALRADPENARAIRNDPQYDPQLRKAIEVAREKLAGKAVSTARQ